MVSPGGYHPLTKLTRDDVPLWPGMVSPGGVFPDYIKFKVSIWKNRVQDEVLSWGGELPVFYEGF